MPIYRFNTYGRRSYVDVAGIELPDDTVANQHALRYFGEMLRDSALSGEVKPDDILIVLDDEDKIVARLTFSMDCIPVQSFVNADRSAPDTIVPIRET